jgi:hypothetical protein
MDGIDGLLWVLAIILAIVSFFVGFVLVRDDPVGKKRLGWAENSPRGLTLFLGVVLIVGALCLVVPMLIPGMGWITPLAAAILAALMLGIAQSYFMKRNNRDSSTYILIMLFLIVLTYGRWSLLAGRFGV